MELPCAWGHDSHTVDLLFSGLISRHDFAIDFFKTSHIFKLAKGSSWEAFWVPLPLQIGPGSEKNH